MTRADHSAPTIPDGASPAGDVWAGADWEWPEGDPAPRPLPPGRLRRRGFGARWAGTTLIACALVALLAVAARERAAPAADTSAIAFVPERPAPVEAAAAPMPARLVAFGRFDDAWAPFARVTAAPEPSAGLFVALARLAAEDGLAILRLGPVGPLTTDAGVIDAAELVVADARGTARICTAVRRRPADLVPGATGLLCPGAGDTAPAHCLLDGAASATCAPEASAWPEQVRAPGVYSTVASPLRRRPSRSAKSLRKS